MAVYGALFALVGLVLVLGSLYLRPEDDPAELALTFARDFGLALVSLGIVGIVLNFRDWRAYFQQRLAEIVVQRQYLQTLDRTELISLQTATLKAFFDVEDLDREGSFLYYFQNRIHELIACPYRENINSVMLFEYVEDDRGKLRVKDTLCYTCRRVGGSIQKEIRWTPEPGEILEIESFGIHLHVPEQSAKTGSVAHPAARGPREIVLGQKELEPHRKGQGYFYDLSELGSCDGLRVEVQATYLIPRRRFFTWTMAHPTRCLNFTLKYPEDLVAEYDLFGILRSEVGRNDGPGFLQIAYEDWVLPGTGIAVELLDRTSPAAAGRASGVEGDSEKT